MKAIVLTCSILASFCTFANNPSDSKQVPPQVLEIYQRIKTTLNVTELFQEAKEDVATFLRDPFSWTILNNPDLLDERTGLTDEELVDYAFITINHNLACTVYMISTYSIEELLGHDMYGTMPSDTPAHCLNNDSELDTLQEEGIETKEQFITYLELMKALVPASTHLAQELTTPLSPYWENSVYQENMDVIKDMGGGPEGIKEVWPEFREELGDSILSNSDVFVLGFLGFMGIVVVRDGQARLVALMQGD